VDDILGSSDQDVTIAVQEKVEMDGYGPWSIKADVPHVQPPASILEIMLSVRLHLDDCSEKNGALRVIPGSHRQVELRKNTFPPSKGYYLIEFAALRLVELC